MDVTVIIPTYNRSILLPYTLQSVLDQTLAPREIIVVDDGSTDDTAQVVGGFAPFIKLIRITNAGSIVARNVGLRKASGEFVAFCDSDDLWRPEFLERMARLWQAEPTTRLAFANFQIISEGVWLKGSKFEDMSPGFWHGLRDLGNGMAVFDWPIVDRLFDDQPFFPSALVADRRSFIEAGGWDEGVGRIVGDDFGTVLRLGELHPFGTIAEPLVGIRKHPGNFSADTRAMHLGDAQILEHVLTTRPSLAIYADKIKQGVARRRCSALDGAFADKDFAAVQRLFPLLPWSFRSARICAKWTLSWVFSLLRPTIR